MTAALVARARFLAWPTVLLLAGSALGTAAFIADAATGTASAVLLALFSSSSSWGLAALITGYATRSDRNAAISGAAVLAVATVAYYVLILVVSRRWALGEAEDGGSAALSGLGSVVRASGFWLFGSICAGAIVGVFGRKIRSGSINVGSVAAGGALGSLSAEGSYHLYQSVILGDLAAFNDVVKASVSLALTLVSTVLMLARRRSGRSWGWWGLAGAISVVAGVVVWSSIESLRSSL